MNELLIAFFIILISFAMFFTIIAILNADKKILELNEKISGVKNINFETFNKVINIIQTINEKIHFGKVKRIFEIIMTTISIYNIIFLIKKVREKLKA